MRLRRDPGLRQRMWRESRPGHARRIAFRQAVDCLKPHPPRRIVGQGAVLHGGIERIEQFARLGAAGGEVRRSGVKETIVQPGSLTLTKIFSAQSHARNTAIRMRACKVIGPNRTKMFHVKHFGTIAGSFLTEILFQNRRIDFRQTLKFRNRDVFVHHMRGRTNAAEFEVRAIGLNETRIRCATAR
jgi:hypothetical protein